MTDGITWKITQLSNRKLEAEIARYNYELFVGGDPRAQKFLDLLWTEFDSRMDAGTMTDDEEPLLSDTRNY